MLEKEIEPKDTDLLIPKQEPYRRRFFMPKREVKTPFLYVGRGAAILLTLTSFVFLGFLIHNTCHMQDKDRDGSCGLGSPVSDRYFYLSLGFSILSTLINLGFSAYFRNENTPRKLEAILVLSVFVPVIILEIFALIFDKKIENVPDFPITLSSDSIATIPTLSGSVDYSSIVEALKAVNRDLDAGALSISVGLALMYSGYGLWLADRDLKTEDELGYSQLP